MTDSPPPPPPPPSPPLPPLLSPPSIEQEQGSYDEAQGQKIPPPSLAVAAQPPLDQFNHQVELEELLAIDWEYDPTLSSEQMAENNVRARWVSKGIWKDEWGPAWPPGSKFRDEFEQDLKRIARLKREGRCGAEGDRRLEKRLIQDVKKDVQYEIQRILAEHMLRQLQTGDRVCESTDLPIEEHAARLVQRRWKNFGLWKEKWSTTWPDDVRPENVEKMKRPELPETDLWSHKDDGWRAHKLGEQQSARVRSVHGTASLI